MAEGKGHLQLKFWGVRGSIPSPGAATAAYGGNTACVEIIAGSRTLIIDAGTGIRALGDKLSSDFAAKVDLFFSHSHFDHIEGLPFFAPLYIAGRPLNLWSGHIAAPDATRSMIASLIRPPYFPIDPSHFRAAINYRDFKAGDTLKLGDDIAIKTHLLNHPGGATGYRIMFRSRSLCYISDVEHRAGSPDPALVGFVSDTDLMIYDAMYTDEEYPQYIGFGHSTWQEAIKLADAASVRTLALYHHFPGRADAELAKIETMAKAARSQTIMARDGLELTL